MSSGSTYGSLSSHSKSKRKLRVEAIDRAAYNVGQSLVTVVNDPRLAEQRSVFSWSFSGDDGRKEAPAPLDPVRYPNVTRQDLEWYVRVVRGHLDKFAQDRQQIHEERLRSAQNAERAGTRNTSGEGLVQAMQHVPGQYFQEDFSLIKPETIQQLFNFEDEGEIRQRIAELNGHLDVVESQLLKEIAARSQSFFEAATSLHELRTLLCDTLSHIKTIRQQMGEMDAKTYRAAVAVTGLQRRRKNLQATLENLKSLDDVVVSRRALDSFMDSQDYAGTLELLENMRHSLDQQSSVGLVCFRSLPPQIRETISVVEALLAHEFLTTARYSELHSTLDSIIASAIASVRHSRPSSQDGDETRDFTPAGTQTSTSSLPSNSSNFHRNSTPNFGSNSTHSGSNSTHSTTHSSHSVSGPMSTSVFGTNSNGWSQNHKKSQGGKCPDGYEPPWALTLPPLSDHVREHLHDRLLPLVVGLYRQNVLGGAVAQLNDAACGDIKTGVNALLDRLLPTLLQQSHDAPIGADTEVQLSDKLQMLDHASFLHLLQAVLRMLHASVQHISLVAQLTEEILKGMRSPRSVLLAVAKDFVGVSHSMLEVAQGRWIKVVAARTQSHQRLKLYQFRELLGACESFGEYIEQQGARQSANYKMSIQVQCKSHLEAMHSRCTTQLQHVLEAESWSAVEVPYSFQEIVDRLFARCARPASPPKGSLQSSHSAHRLGSSHNTPGETSGAEGDIGNGKLNGIATSPRKDAPDHAASGVSSSFTNQSGNGASHPAPNTLDPGGRISQGGGNGSVSGNGAVGTSRSGSLSRNGAMGMSRGELVNTSSSSSNSSNNISSMVSGSGGVGNNSTAPVRSHSLNIGGKGFHIVNALLILLKLLEEYLLLYDAMPMFRAETAKKVVDLLTQFNEQTCNLVLGAGAMKTAGLKSISAKHLALSCQCLGGVAALQPPLRTALTSNVPPAWKALLLPDFDHLLEDVTKHMAGIHKQLVSIMQDRLQASTRHLAQEAEAWGVLYLGTQPSEAVRLMTKQLMTLNQVLSPILLPEEVHSIFGRVATLYSEALAETLDSLPHRGEQWELQRQVNARHILHVFRELPLEPHHASAHLSRLTTFYAKHYGALDDATAATAAPPS